MKKFFLTLLITFFTIHGHGQLKTYDGIYADGRAIYTYYLDQNQSRSFEGNFSYKYYDYYITGKYHNNLKTGLWKSNLLGFKEKINYKNGFKEGEYSLYFEEGENELKITSNKNYNHELSI